MTKTDRFVNEVANQLVHTYRSSHPLAPFNKIGNLRTELDKLLTKEANNSLTEEDSIRLTAYKNTFDFSTDYSIERWFEVDFPSSVEVNSHGCDDLAQARRFMSGEEEMDAPELNPWNLDYTIGECREKEIFVPLTNLKLKEEFNS